MATPDRQDLIRNAVVFLADPKTQSASPSQRMQFLEAKGLSSGEIDEAMRQAALVQSSSRASVSYGPAYPPVYGPPAYAVQPPLQRWDWRDYFITAVISGGLAYGAVSLFKKYVLPHLQPPSSTAYEADRDALTAQFDVAETLLKEIQEESAAVRIAVEAQNAKVEKATQDVEQVVQEIKEGELKTRDEMREIREEVNNVREMLPKMVEKNKESHAQSLAELQQELKSLKALLLSRGSGVSSGLSTPILPLKPSIPAWQLAGASSTTQNGGTPVSSPLPSAPNAASFPLPNGRSKEVELSSES